jgi:3-oxoacyl-[acyl-carrier-protein] synthase II
LEKRRVVITGLGAITPLGNSVPVFWDGLVTGRSGVAPTMAFDTSKLSTRISAEVKDFDPDALFGRREARRMDRYAQFALAAAREAIEDAKFPDDPEVRDRTGAIVATGIGGIITVENTTFEVGPTQRWDRISPFFVPMLMGNAASAQISMNFGLRGPVFAVGSACASANDAFTVAYDKIVLGDAIAIVTGGSEATVIPTAMGGFCSMKAMTTRNDDPTHASRPFDKERDGFVLGEGAGVLVLEDREFALARGARIYAEVLGYGQSADAFHIAQPDPESRGVILAMQRALARSGVSPEQVGYVNAHGTSTPLGDAAESQAIERHRRYAGRLVDEVDARSSARRGRRDRRDRDRARAAPRDHPADDQLRSPRSRVHARLRPERSAQGRSRRRDVERVRVRRSQHVRGLR